MAVTGTEGLLLLVGRVLLGGVLAFTGVHHFLEPEGMTGYARAKGLPAPKLAVYGSGVLLVLGGLAIVAGLFPAIAAVVLAAFLIVAAVTMHDFWAVPEDQAQSEMNSFLKNVAMAGGALVVAAVATQEWAYSVGLGLF